MRLPITRTALALAALLIAPIVESNTIRVPADQGTLRAAIESGDTGDTVIVAPGTYTGEGNRDLDFGGRDLVLLSEAGAAVTVLDAERQSRLLTFRTGESRAARVAGFTLRGGFAWESGGGIQCQWGTGPSIAACVIENCTSSSYGGGIEIAGSTAEIVGCTIRDNRAAGIVGRGGGIGCSGGSATIRQCLIENNEAKMAGGGVFCLSSDPSIKRCLIRGNRAAIRGGGVYCRISSAPTIEGCLIVDNSAPSGGGVHCYVLNTPHFVNCTIADNTAAQGGAIYVGINSAPLITNSILWGNQPSAVFDEGVGTMIEYSDVAGGWPGTGNIDLNPGFATFGGRHYLLGPESPAIDAGSPSAVDGVWDSHPRWPPGVQNRERADQGAYGGAGNGEWLGVP